MTRSGSMDTVRPGMGAALALALMVVCACGPRVNQLDSREGFDAAGLAAGRLAVGGAVLGPLADLDRAAAFSGQAEIPGPLAQSDRWAPLLYGEFLSGRPDLDCWPWGTVRGQVPPEELTGLLERWGSGRLLPADQVRELGRFLPGVAHLALARIDRIELSTMQSMSAVETGQRMQDGRDVHAETLGRMAKTRREVTVSLELFDIRTGESVWYGSGQADHQELMNAAEAPEQQPTGTVDLQGSPLKAPDLDGVFAEACRVLIGKLPGWDQQD